MIRGMTAPFTELTVYDHQCRIEEYSGTNLTFTVDGCRDLWIYEGPDLFAYHAEGTFAYVQATHTKDGDDD